VDREKKSLGRSLSDLLADAGSDIGWELVKFLQPEPEELAGLFFCLDRLQFRRAWYLRTALSIALTDQIPPQAFEAITDTPEEAMKEYSKYLMRQRIENASRTS